MNSLPFDLEALVERQVGSGLDALDVVLGGEEAAGSCGRCSCGKSAKSWSLPLASATFVVAVANADERQVLSNGLMFANATAASAQLVEPVAGDDFIDEAARLRLGAADVPASGHHFECLRHTDETGQTLRAAGTRQQTEVDFGQTELRADATLTR